MVTRVGHITLRVRDLDAAVDFQQRVIGMVQSERAGNAAYLTCNDRHHELVLVAGDQRGYDQIGLEVPDAATLQRAKLTVASIGGRVLRDVYDGEPGIDRALLISGPGGHVFKLFCGMASVTPAPAGDRPLKFEHVSLKARNPYRLERFLRGLGFGFSDRMGPFASWWHCGVDHHGVAITLAPGPALSHYAYAWPDLDALGRVADRLVAERATKPIWGPSRHGPGNNHFLYLLDEDGAMIENCSELIQLVPGHGHEPRHWPIDPTTINQWGGPPPLRFLRAGYPITPLGVDRAVLA